MSMSQQQFLDVIDRNEAERRFLDALHLEPLGVELLCIDRALGRVLGRDVVAAVDVPSFDRSNFDGFAVRAADTFGADEQQPRPLTLLGEVIATAVVPDTEIKAATALSIATGGMLPRGADAVVMVEHADLEGGTLLVRKAVTPGFGVAFAGTDISAGETVLRRGQQLTSRETGVLAAIGLSKVHVHQLPRVGIISTGNEIVEPGQPMRPGLVYDSNTRIIADAVRELGGEPLEMGIVSDDLDKLRRRFRDALDTCDVVLLSGGTSKGAGDLSYHVASELGDPGIVAHGVALKPGKPICLAASGGKAVVILPGFPTSAIFTFHEFVAPVIRRLAARSPGICPGKNSGHATVAGPIQARLAVKVNSEIGRTEYLLVGLVEAPDTASPQSPLVAYPMGKGSGSITTFSRADGFVTIDRHEEIVEAGTVVPVQLLGKELAVADLVVIGSHCVGLDYLLGRMQDLGFATKFLAVGSTAGLASARRGECDVAGIHLLDESSGEYNRPFLSPELELIAGYGRMQGVVFRPDDDRFTARNGGAAIEAVKNDGACIMVNRNRGSGTRILIDRLLNGAQPNGYAVQARNHNAVAAAVAQSRADWGVAIRSVAAQSQLGFLTLTEERYDFVTPRSRAGKPAIEALRGLLTETAVRRHLQQMGMLMEE